MKRLPLPRRRTRIQPWPALVGLLAIALLAAACSANERPSIEGDGAVSTTAVDGADPAPTAAPLPVEDAPDDAPRLLLATPQGAVRWRAGEADSLRPAGVELFQAEDDMRGGIVGLTIDATQLATLSWWPAGDVETQTLRSQGGLDLHGVIDLNADPAAVVTRSELTEETPTELLEVLRLPNASGRTVAIVGDETSGAGSVATATNRYVVVQVSTTCSEIVIFDEFGESSAVPGLETPDCTVTGPNPYGPVALAPDGDELAIVTLESDDSGATIGARVQIRSLASGAEITSFVLPGRVDDITGIDFDGRWVVVSRGELSPREALLIDSDDADHVIEVGPPAHRANIIDPASALWGT